ncbi:MAG: hypothetical protein AAFQ94_29305 [Bacteroidota bacterium]
MRQLLYICVFTVILACSKNENLVERPDGEIVLQLVDSFPLFNDSLVYQHFDIANIQEGKVLAFKYPLLDLTAIDESGEFHHISSSGDAPKEHMSFIESLYDSEGEYLFVLQQYNVSKLNIFNDKHDFVGSINLSDALAGYFPAPYESHLRIKKLKKDIYKVFIALNSTTYNRYEKNYYDGFSLAELTIDIKNLTVADVELRLPFSDNQVIQQALSGNEKFWKVPTPYFDIGADEYYVYYDFNKALHVYDQDWNLKRIYPMKFIVSPYRRSTSFRFIENTEDMLVEESRIKFSIGSLLSLSLGSRYVYMIYHKPIAPELIPNDFNQIRKSVQSRKVLHVIDLETGEQFATQLPPHINGYELKATNDNHIFLLTDPNVHEDIYAFKFKTTLKK